MKQILKKAASPTIAVAVLALALALGTGVALGQSSVSSATTIATPGTYQYVGTSAVPFNNGWANYLNGYARARYYKDSLGIVHLEGVIVGGGGNNVAFVLPAGYRPQFTHAFVVAAGAGNLTDDVDVYKNGHVFINGANDPAALDGISFRTR